MAAVIPRLTWVAFAAREPDGFNDPLFYRGYGRGIASGLGYVASIGGRPTAYWPPGYPYFVGALTWLQDHILLPSLPVTLGLVQAALGTATAVAVASMALRWWGAGPALVAGLTMAWWPNLVIHTTLFLSETVFLFLMVATVWCATRVPLSRDTARASSDSQETSPDASTGRDTSRFLPILGAAVAFALSVMVRPQGATIVIVLVALWLPMGWRRVAAHLLVVFAVTALAVAPWLARNHAITGRYTFATNTGDNLCISYNPESAGGFNLSPTCRYLPDEMGPRAEAERDREGTSRALDYLRSNPERLPGLVVGRLRATVDHDHDGLRAVEDYAQNQWLASWLRSALRWASDLWWYVAAAATLPALVALVRRRADRYVALSALGVLATLAPPLATFGDARFKIPAVPFVALLVAGSWIAVRRGRRRASATSVVDGGEVAAAT